MKKLLILGLVLFAGATVNAQETCEDMHKVAAKYLAPSQESQGVFISDGQVYSAFFSGDADEEAEFSASFYGGSTYRIAATAGSKDSYVIFEMIDIEGNTLFSNKEYMNAPYWDFKIESTIDVRIIMKMDTDKKENGCATMLIGFKQ